MFLAIVGCGDDGGSVSPDAAPPIDAGAPSLQVELARVPAIGADPIEVTAIVHRGAVPADDAAVEIEAAGGQVGPVTALGQGRYRATITPAQPSGELPITVRALGLSVERTAIVMAVIDDGWGQAEAVPGLVNTLAYEDSAEVSPDGEWLLVSDTSPIDLICCVLGCGPDGAPASDPAGAACNHVLGPYGAPERPGFPGADRIVSPTEIHDELPRVGLDLPDGVDFQVALPPVAAYGFHRQPDGSFAEPFSIAFDADGLPGLYGLTFASPIVGGEATLLFALDTLDQSATSPGVDLYTDPVVLGRPHNLGTYSVGPGGQVMVDRYPARVALTSYRGVQGNPGLLPDGVIYDSENAQDDLFFAAGDLRSGAPLAAPVQVALSRAGRGERMPHFHDGRLYFSVDAADVRSSARTPGGDPAAAATWSAERIELGSEAGATRVGAVVAVGEPSIEVRDGVESLYFVYASKTATGLDLDVGRVRRRLP